MHHNLKIFTKYFQTIADHRKTGEVRLNDRNYQIGDSVTLHEGQSEIDGFQYTGRKVSALISYIDDYGCEHGYVNLSYSGVGMLIVDDEVSA